MNELQQRQAVIAEARTWLSTPWHHDAAVKGAGVDCGQIIAKVFAAVGLIERPTVAEYPSDWALHRSEERYLDVVQQYAHRIDAPQPGDIVVWKFGRTFSHGAIVVQWPQVIHAQRNEGVCYADATKGILEGREHMFYSVWAA